jgi:hypothetical protein
MTNVVTVYLSKDMVLFQNVDRKGFKEMVKTLDTRYALHARTHFSQIWDAKTIRQGPQASGETKPYY